MREPDDEDDVVEQGGAPLRLPGWARRPRWLPAVADGGRWRRPLGRSWFRRDGVSARASRWAAVPSNLGVAVLSGLAQTGRACSVQRGRELQLGVKVINLSDAAVTLGQVRPMFPRGGLRLVSQQWAPCGALSASACQFADRTVSGGKPAGGAAGRAARSAGASGCERIGVEDLPFE